MPNYYHKKAPKRRYDMQRSSDYAIRCINRAVYNLQQANEYHRTFYGHYDKTFELIASSLVESKQKIIELIGSKK